MKAFVWVVWLGTLALSVVGLSGVLPAGSWINQEMNLIGTLSALIGIGLFLGSTLVVLLIGSEASSKRVSSWVLGRPSLVRKSKANTLQTGLKQALIDSVGDSQSSPSTILARAVAESSCETPIWPWELGGAVELASEFHTRVQRSLLLRLLLPDIAKSLSQKILQTRDFLEEFSSLREVEKAEYLKTGVGDKGQLLFSEWVSNFSGALMLADGVHTRAGFPKAIRVLNLGSFRNSASGVSSETYFSTHVGTEASCGAGQSMRKQEKTLADDFDGRVLDLLATAVVRDPLKPGVELLMIAGESCYAATEVDPDLKCKDLDPSPGLGLGFKNNEDMKFAAEISANRRTCLVTVTALVISESMGSAGRPQSNIILLRRPKDTVVRNGSDVSAPPGGVVNIGVGDHQFNTAPDVHKAIQKELEEEMGLSLEDKAITPFGVFIVNERGAKGRGQIVATAGFLARTSLSVSEIKMKHSEASKHEGKYEAVSYDVIALPEPQDLEQLSEAGRLSEAKKFAQAFLEFGNVIDQRTIVAALYLSADLFGKQATKEAFEQVWGKPWQEFTWKIDSAPASELGRLATVLK
jgi:ADP-ribose pyrophosphatase YjhB (NUDIX family)